MTRTFFAILFSALLVLPGASVVASALESSPGGPVGAFLVQRSTQDSGNETEAYRFDRAPELFLDFDADATASNETSLTLTWNPAVQVQPSSSPYRLRPRLAADQEALLSAAPSEPVFVRFLISTVSEAAFDAPHISADPELGDPSPGPVVEDAPPAPPPAVGPAHGEATPTAHRAPEAVNVQILVQVVEYQLAVAGAHVYLVPVVRAVPCPEEPPAAATSCLAPAGPRRKESAQTLAARAAAVAPDGTLLFWALAGVALILFLSLGWKLAGLLPLFSRFDRGELLDHPRRSRILDCIQSEPGLEFGEIARRLEIPNGALQHHLGLLERQRFVSRCRDGRSTRFYACTTRIPDGARLSMTRQRILDHVGEAGRVTATEIAQRLGHRVQSVWHHLRRLEARGFLAPEKRGRLIFWTTTAPARQD